MGKLFTIMGKSASGKDTVYHRLLEDKELNLKEIVIYTTRPMRAGETDGKTYNFTDEAGFRALKASGRVIEDRCYDTVCGPWYYFTVDDGEFDSAKDQNYIIIGTPESYGRIREYYGIENVIPVYIEVEDGERLIRAIRRDQQSDKPGYEETCRRFFADAEDFAEDKLEALNIKKRFDNVDIDICFGNIKEYIKAF